MHKKIISLGMLLSISTMNISFAGTNYSYKQEQTTPTYQGQYYQQQNQYNAFNAMTQPLQGNVTMVPPGSSMPAVMTSPLSSATARTGDIVSMALNSDFYYNNKLIAPAGSVIVGSIIEASKAKRGGINGKLCVRFTQINTPYGNQIPISGIIKTDDGSGVLKGGTAIDTAKEYAKDATVGVAAGALSGLVFGALAGGSVGRGAALGTAVGAGGGLVKSAWDKGQDVEIPANANMDIILTQQMTVSSYSYEN